MGTPEPLTVESRPAVQWVASLPRTWAHGPQRTVLFALACDAWDDTSRPGVDNLAAWCGLPLGSAWQALRDLCGPVAGVRPPLLERVDRYGNRIDPDARRGRERTGFRFVLSQPSGNPEGSRDVPEERSQQPSGNPDGSGVEPSANRQLTVSQPSGNPDAPCPPLPTNSSHQVPTDGAPDDEPGGGRKLASWRDLRKRAVNR